MSSLQKRTRTCRTIETSINRDTIVSQVAAFLYAAGIINDDEHVTDITFGDITAELVPIKIHFKQQQKLEVIKH